MLVASFMAAAWFLRHEKRNPPATKQARLSTHALPLAAHAALAASPPAVPDPGALALLGGTPGVQPGSASPGRERRVAGTHADRRVLEQLQVG